MIFIGTQAPWYALVAMAAVMGFGAVFILRHPSRIDTGSIFAGIPILAAGEINDRELQDFANGRLAAFKVPKKIVILAEIPKGATGKLQRIGLARRLGLCG